MPLTVSCPSCDKSLRVADGSTGMRIACPKCKHVFRCPAEAPPAPEVQPVANDLVVDAEELAAAGVGQRLEKWAEVPTGDELGELIVAFANAQGGNILIGVDTDGTVIGCDFGELKRIFKEVADDLAEQLPDRQMLYLHRAQIEGETVGVVSVGDAKVLVYSMYGQTIIRDGAEIRDMTDEEINRLAPPKDERKAYMDMAAKQAAMLAVEEQNLDRGDFASALRELAKRTHERTEFDKSEASFVGKLRKHVYDKAIPYALGLLSTASAWILAKVW